MFRCYALAMTSMQPIYTLENTTCAFQLIWNVTLFWRVRFAGDAWLPELKTLSEPAGIRLLQLAEGHGNCTMFLISTRGHLSPQEIVRGLKGRLQTIVRQENPNAFRRNYDIQSIGSTTREKTENYVERQLVHHDIVLDQSPAVSIADLQLVDPDLDLSRYRFTSHGRYRCNIHVVFRFRKAERSLNHDELLAVRGIIRKTATKHQLLLSRLGLLDDHLHLVLGILPSIKPAELVCSFMNNIAWKFGMRPVLWPSCYLGTIGEYDLGAVSR